MKIKPETENKIEKFLLGVAYVLTFVLFSIGFIALARLLNDKYEAESVAIVVISVLVTWIPAICFVGFRCAMENTGKYRKATAKEVGLSLIHI